MINAKNKILELLAKRGLSSHNATYSQNQHPNGMWISTLTLSLPNSAALIGTGSATSKSQADIKASEDVLAQLHAAPTADWEAHFADAQKGDALLKLAAYLSETLGNREDRSRWLQHFESDTALAALYDRWYAEGAPELAEYGPGIGEMGAHSPPRRPAGGASTLR